MRWLLPHDLRARYVAEWEADLDGAADLGLDRRDLRRGQRRMAWHLRRRRMSEVLGFHRGAARGIGWWAVLLIGGLVVIAPWLGLYLPPILLATLLVLSWRAPRHRALLALLTLAWAACLVGAFWLWGVGFDYLDANLTPPWWAKLWAPLLLGSAAPLVLFGVVRARALRPRVAKSVVPPAGRP